MTVAHAGTYTDPGATAQDGVDGTMSVEVSHAVDTATVGVYTVNYSVTDSAGNTGTESRTVRVTDQTAPVITLNGAAAVNRRRERRTLIWERVRRMQWMGVYR